MLKSRPDFCGHLVVAGLLLILAACSTVPKSTDVDASNNTNALWLQHRQQIENISQWRIKGRAALRSDSDSWSAALTWQQNDETYQVRLAGPFGQGAITIEGDGDSVSVHIAGQPAVVASDAELLLSQQLGWTVPVSLLPYWLRGVPAPGQVDAMALNESSGVLDQLIQNGWQVDYSAYRALGGVNLPRKIQIENDSLRLKLVLDRWNLGKEQ